MCSKNFSVKINIAQNTKSNNCSWSMSGFNEIYVTRRFGPLRGPPSSSCGGLVAYGHLGGPFGPSQLDFLILGKFLFWVTFDIGSMLILGQFLFWVHFDFGSL